MMYQAVPTATTSRGGTPTESADYLVTLDQIPRWSDVEQRSSSSSLEGETGDPAHSNPRYANPLASSSSEAGGSAGNAMVSKFPLDLDIISKIYLWRGEPWNLEVDAVVNSTNENLDEAHSSPGLHAAAGPGLAEQCATLGGCRTGMAKVTNAYDLPARRVIHTVGPKYAVKYHTAAENALSHCYRSCLELLIDNGLQSIAMDCIYTEAKNYPREPAAHVAIRTVRRFLEKQKDKISAVVFCTTTTSDTEIYKRLLPLYFPRDEHEEEVAISKLPADVGDENGETVIDERKIRIQALPNKPPVRSFPALVERPATDLALVRRNSNHLDSYLDPAFMSLIKDPDERRKEQWEKTAQAQSGFNFVKLLGFGDLGGPLLSPAEEYSLHSRYLAKANSLNLSEIAEMKIVYRGGVDTEGHPVMVVVGAHFLLRCLDLERFVLYVIKEFEPLIQKPYSIVYFHSAASLQVQPDLGWMKRLQQILGHKHQRNLQEIYVLHPTFHLKATIVAMQLFVDNVVWKKVVYADRLLQLFKYVPREQLTIPDFVFQHDLEKAMEEILATISIALAVTIFIVLSFSIYLTIRIFTGKSRNDKEYSPVHATIFDLFFHNDKLYEYQTEIARKKPTYRFLSPGQSEIFTADPRNVEHILKTRFDNYSKGDNGRENLGDLLGHGIFTVDGEKWRQQRKLASFEFSTRVLRDFSCSVFRTNACKLVGVVSEFALSGKSFDAQEMFMRYALESIFKVGFGVELKCLDEYSKEGEEFMEAFDEGNVATSFRYIDPLWKLKRFLNIGSQSRLKKCIDTIDKFVYKLITTKREELAEEQNTAVREDILSRFLVVNEKDPEKMNDKYLRDIILNFMVAGKDTAAASLSWFMYMLCKNPLVQERIVQEIREVTSSDERTTDVNGFAKSISEEALNKMHYLHAALSETLRLYPIVPLNMRCAENDDILADGHRVKRGDNVYYMAYAMGRMTYIWGQDAEEFKPERWLKDGVFQPESPFKFISFHGGPRICLGKDFAYRQMKIVSMVLLHFFRLKMADEKSNVRYKRMLTLHIEGGLHLHAIPRTSI